MDTMGSRIRDLRIARHMSQEELGKIIGVQKAAIYKYESGLVVNLKRSVIQKLADALHTTPAFLMGWDEDFDVFSIPGVMPLPKMKKVPRLGTIACGKPILAVENIEEFDEVPEDIHCDFTLTCKGDSMIGARILDGDIVYIRQQPDVEDGEIAAVIIDDDATLKRVFKVPGRIQLRAENPAYAPINITEQDGKNVHIIGKAVFFRSAVR